MVMERMHGTPISQVERSARRRASTSRRWRAPASRSSSRRCSATASSTPTCTRATSSSTRRRAATSRSTSASWARSPRPTRTTWRRTSSRSSTATTAASRRRTSTRAGCRPDTRVDEFEAAIRAVCEPIFARPLKEIYFGKLLLRLFQTSRRFNVEVQPQLVMLQKTLLNIEGLGRELDPDLDLWRPPSPISSAGCASRSAGAACCARSATRRRSGRRRCRSCRGWCTARSPRIASARCSAALERLADENARRNELLSAGAGRHRWSGVIACSRSCSASRWRRTARARSSGTARFRGGVTPWDARRRAAASRARGCEARPRQLRVLIPGCGSGYEVRAVRASRPRRAARSTSPTRRSKPRGASSGRSRHGKEGRFLRASTSAAFDLVYERAFLCALPRRAVAATGGGAWRELVRPGGELAGFFYLRRQRARPALRHLARRSWSALLAARVRAEPKTRTSRRAVHRRYSRARRFGRCGSGSYDCRAHADHLGRRLPAGHHRHRAVGGAAGARTPRTTWSPAAACRCT